MAKEAIDNQNVKSKRDSFRERLAQRYPDLNMDDDEAVYNQIATDYDQYDQSKKRMDDFNNMLKENPHAPGLVTGLITKKNADGGDFNLIDYLIDELGQDYIEAINGDDEARKRLKASEKEKLDASEKLAKGKETLAANMEQEDKELDAAMKEAKIKPEAIKDLIEWMYKRSDDGEDHDDDGFVWRAARYGLKKADFLRLFQIKDFDKAVLMPRNVATSVARTRKSTSRSSYMMEDRVASGTSISMVAVVLLLFQRRRAEPNRCIARWLECSSYQLRIYS
jgi:hypothetical protein